MNEGAVWLAAVVVISGVSSTLVTVIWTAQLPTPPWPSSASTTIRYTLSRPKGFSKSGRMLKLRTPDALILKCGASLMKFRPQVMVSAGFRSSSVYV